MNGLTALGFGVRREWWVGGCWLSQRNAVTCPCPHVYLNPAMSGIAQQHSERQDSGRVAELATVVKRKHCINECHNCCYFLREKIHIRLIFELHLLAKLRGPNQEAVRVSPSRLGRHNFTITIGHLRSLLVTTNSQSSFSNQQGI